MLVLLEVPLFLLAIGIGVGFGIAGGDDRGLTVLVWTASEELAKAAEADGLRVYRGNPIEDASGDAPSDLDQLDYALAVGADEALNAMVATDLSEYFGRGRVFQLPVKDERTADFYTRAQVLFDDSASHDELLSRIKAGAEITVTEAPDADRGAALPMFVHTPGKDLRVLTAGDQPDLQAGEELIAMVERGKQGS